MKTFIFASLRGPNFISQGNTVQEAWEKLCEKEQYNGTIWRMQDPYMVEHCIKSGKWQRLGDEKYGSVAYQESHTN